MDSEHTDQAFEAALARGLRRNTGPGAHCPEPELIAAYVDGTLLDDERSSWEGHVAGCARCQAHLAALARTAPIEAVPARLPRSHLGWLFDWHWLTAASGVAVVAVAGVAVWLANPDQLPGADTPPVSAARAARVATQAPPERIGRTPGGPEQQEAPAAVTPAAGPQPQLEALGEPERVAQREDAFAEPVEIAAEVDALPALDQQRFERGAIAPSRAPSAPMPAAERRVRDALSASSAPAVRALAVSDETFAFVESPARRARWRVVPNGAIEHSRDGGSTWIVQLAEPGAILTAGSAPSDVVCWLIGRAGAVFRTSDGATWARLPAPAPDDLASIEAEDARTATVTTAGGVSFRTVDGGQTWATLVDRSPR